MSLASEVAGYVVERVSPGPSNQQGAQTRTEAPGAPPIRPVPAPLPSSATSPATSTEPLPPAQPVGLRATEPQPAAPAEDPTHVSEEPELVEELAEPGAEGGAGAELHIREPWDGYRRMNAREVTARLGDASRAELAAVQLYESSTRGRQTVLSAVERQLHRANGNGFRA